MWAATGTGLERSTDGGRTFRPVPSAPGLVAVEEPEPVSLVALTPDGRVLTARGDGPWTRLGRLTEGGKATVLTAVTWTFRHGPATGSNTTGIPPWGIH